MSGYTGVANMLLTAAVPTHYGVDVVHAFQAFRIGAMRIVNHRLVDVPFRAAPCHGGPLRESTVVVLHDTGGSLRPYSSVEWFENPQSGVSAHVVIERDGTVTQMVPFDCVAYHAGQSSWRGRKGVNSFGIGIEIVNPGMMQRFGDEVQLRYGDKVVERFQVAGCIEVDTPEHGRGWCLPYTDEQMDALRAVCRALVKVYPITEIVTHWMISPGRKVDTTPLMLVGAMNRDVFDESVVGTITYDTITYDASMAAPAVVPAQKAGIFDGLSFAKVNELADQGSRIAQAFQRVKRWWWGAGITGSTAAASIDTSKGTGAVIKAFVAEHPFAFVALVLGVIGAAAWLSLKIVEKYLVTAAKDGRYTPRGGQ